MNRLTKNISLFAILLFLIKFSFLKAYYDSFNINILNYMDYSEILLSNSNFIVFFSTTFLLLYLFFFDKLNHKNNKETILINDSNIGVLKNTSRFFLILVSFLILVKIFVPKVNDYTYKPYLYFFITIFLLLAVFLNDVSNDKSKLINVFKNKLINYIVVSCIFFFIAHMFAVAQVISIKTGKFKKTHTSFKYKTSFVFTSDILIDIGETKSTVFIYDKNKEQTFIYNKTYIDSTAYYNWDPVFIVLAAKRNMPPKPKPFRVLSPNAGARL